MLKERTVVRLLLLTAVADFEGVGEIYIFFCSQYHLLCTSLPSVFLHADRSQHVDGHDEGECHQCAPHDPHRGLDQLDLFRIRNK